MTWLIGLLVAVVLLLSVVAFRRPRRPEAPLDPETAVQTAIELHRIHRQLDVAEIRSEQRQGVSRLRRDIGDALEDYGA
jgi:hypothetical protein